MSGLFLIEPEKPMQCELCGKIEETRPYGPNGERVCFDCGQKDQKALRRGLNKYILGEGNS